MISMSPFLMRNANNYRDDQLVITMPKAVIDLDYFHKFDCDNNNCTDTDCKNWAELGNAHCTYNEVL